MTEREKAGISPQDCIQHDSATDIRRYLQNLVVPSASAANQEDNRTMPGLFKYKVTWWQVLWNKNFVTSKATENGSPENPVD